MSDPAADTAPLPPAGFARLVAPVWDYLTVAERPARADVIFVFGSQALAVPDHAARLYRAGTRRSCWSAAATAG